VANLDAGSRAAEPRSPIRRDVMQENDGYIRAFTPRNIKGGNKTKTTNEDGEVAGKGGEEEEIEDGGASTRGERGPDCDDQRGAREEKGFGAGHATAATTATTAASGGISGIGGGPRKSRVGESKRGTRQTGQHTIRIAEWVKLEAAAGGSDDAAAAEMRSDVRMTQEVRASATGLMVGDWFGVSARHLLLLVSADFLPRLLIGHILRWFLYMNTR